MSTMSLVNKEQIYKAFGATLEVIETTLQISVNQELSTDEIIRNSVDALYEYSQDQDSFVKLNTMLRNIMKSLSGLIDILDFAQIRVIDDPVPYKFYGMKPQIYINLINSLRKDTTKDKVTPDDLKLLLHQIEATIGKKSVIYRIHLILLILELLKQYTSVAVIARLIESQTILSLELI